ncbi:MAG: PIG-L family deacetylase [Anaerolineaceae bacterium]|nr:PIG-L family deacetylase [Anaerolineaceae bacterium]
MKHNMTFIGRKICFIGAHPDDIELGCGALIAHISGKSEIFCITLSDNQKNPLLKNLLAEHQRSMSILGVQPENNIVSKFETRRFSQHRQEILEYLIDFNHKHHPEIVFVHSKSDNHQDHGIVTNEAFRAFRGCTLLGFEIIRSSSGFTPSFLVEVDEADVKKKIDALSQYKTYQGKYYFSPDLTRATLIRNGALAERPFAEGFDILRIIE